MDISKEEKKAIEMLKDRQKDLLEGSKSSFYSSDRELYKKHAEAIDTISNLIEKLQKEIIKLKQEQAKRSWIHVKENGEVEPLLYISKDKIRKKIEELENGEQCYYEFSTGDLVDLLKILLEEE